MNCAMSNKRDGEGGQRADLPKVSEESEAVLKGYDAPLRVRETGPRPFRLRSRAALLILQKLRRSDLQRLRHLPQRQKRHVLLPALHQTDVRATHTNTNG